MGCVRILLWRITTARTLYQNNNKYCKQKVRRSGLLAQPVGFNEGDKSKKMKGA